VKASALAEVIMQIEEKVGPLTRVAGVADLTENQVARDDPEEVAPAGD
jgi:hypothetical protein